MRSRSPPSSFKYSRFWRVPVDRLSTTRTLRPWRRSASAMWLPMNPAPPVTRYRIGPSLADVAASSAARCQPWSPRPSSFNGASAASRRLIAEAHAPRRFVSMWQGELPGGFTDPGPLHVLLLLDLQEDERRSVRLQHHGAA